MNTVLVVMPLFNARPYVRAAVESILAQTYPHFILLVINDGSTDGSETELSHLRDPRILLWQQENQGPGAAMNRALHYALEQDIPYLARMDADDLSHPQRLERQVALLENHPRAAACSANCRYVNADSAETIGTSTISTSPALIRWEITHGLRGMIQGAALFRTLALASINGYRTSFRRAEEVDVFLRLAARFELRNCPEFLYDIRMRPGSLSTQNVHENVLYQFYALDCAKRRCKNQAEQTFDDFCSHLSLTKRYRIWREEATLRLWRGQMDQRRISTLLLAALIDPRRPMVRLLRKLDGRKTS